MQKLYKCPQCGKDVPYITNPCPNCRLRLDWRQQPPIPYIPPTGELQQQAAKSPVKAGEQPIYQQPVYLPPVIAPQPRTIQPAINILTKHRASKFLYLGTSVIAFIVGFISLLFFSPLVWVICTLYVYIVFAILLYKAWCIFPYIWTLSLPTQAIYFLTVPFSGHVCAFYIIGGFPKEFNAYMAENSNIKYKMNASIFLIYCGLNIILFITYFGRNLPGPFSLLSALVAIASWVLLLIMINQMYNAITAINIVAHSEEIQPQPDNGQ